MRPVPIQPSFSSVGVGNRKFLRGVERNDFCAARREDHLFLDARGRDAVGGGAISFHREDHTGLELDRLAQWREAGDDWPVVEVLSDAMGEGETYGITLDGE